MILPVPHITQQSNSLRNDCGPACITMLIRAVTDTRPTLEAVAASLGPWGDRPVIPARLIELARARGLLLAYTNAGTIDWHRAALEAGAPTIALVDRGRLWGGPPLAHYVLIAGATPTHILIHDPLCTRGYLPATWARFEAAITAAVAGAYSIPRQALIPAAHRTDVYDNAAAAIIGRGERARRLVTEVAEHGT